MDFMKNYPADEPVVMLNLLKFKEKSGKGDESGAAAYKRYSKNVAPMLAKVGGKLIWSGKPQKTLIGGGETPDMVLLVEYPNKGAFIAMATSPKYKIVGVDREMALEYGGLIACKTM